MDKNLNLNQTSFITEKLDSMAAIIKGLNIFSFFKSCLGFLSLRNVYSASTVLCILGLSEPL